MRRLRRVSRGPPTVRLSVLLAAVFLLTGPVHTIYCIYLGTAFIYYMRYRCLRRSHAPLPAMTAKFNRLDLDPALRARRTTPDYVADALRKAILEGQFKDGEELNQVELAEYFGVSRVPVREALRQLQAEGLINAEAHRRAVVTGVSPERILEIFELRAVFEDFLLKKAAPRIDGLRLRRLRELCDEMDKINDRREWLAKNREFHLTLHEPSGNKIALDLDEQLMLRVERYLQEGGFVNPDEAGVDHRKILDALERKDVAQARRELELHIKRTSERLAKRLGHGAETQAVGDEGGADAAPGGT